MEEIRTGLLELADSLRIMEQAGSYDAGTAGAMASLAHVLAEKALSLEGLISQLAE